MAFFAGADASCSCTREKCSDECETYRKLKPIEPVTNELKTGGKEMSVAPYPVAPVNSEKVQLTKSEADALKNHLEFSIIAEITASAGDYDNLGYLTNLIRIYEKCRMG